ncbi:MAG: hypothetical protein ACTSUO_10135 [Candidatus Thorarchaeota archaeon]
MEAVLKFQLPEEREEFRVFQEGATYLSILQEIDNSLRTKTKYGSADERVSWEELREQWYQLLSQFGIDIWEY